MIHQLLNLTRPLFCLDLETTGLDYRTARIVELGFQRWEAVGMTREWRSLINPGISIPSSATAVHHITNEMVFDRPRFSQIAENLAQGFTNCDYTGKNIRFDLRILAAEFRRVKVAWSYEGARIIDIDRLESLAHPRNLAALHTKYVGQPHEEAHSALSDVRASITVVTRQLQWYTFPRDLDTLHALQWPGWITLDGSVRLVNGIPTMMFGKHRDKPISEVPNDYWNFILSNDFPPDLKRIALDAKLGRYSDERSNLPKLRQPDGPTDQPRDRGEVLGVSELPEVSGNTTDGIGSGSGESTE